MIVERDFLTHWKTRLLISELGETAPLYLIALWGHCEARRTDTFDKMPPAVLAAVCSFPGKPKALDLALQAGPWIYREGDLVTVHGWRERNTKLLASIENGKKGGRPKKQSQPTDSPNRNPEETHGFPLGNSQANPQEPVEMRGDKRSIPPIVPQGGPGEISSGALEETETFLCELFGRKKGRLSYEAKQKLAVHASTLPLSEAQKKLLARWKALPDDPNDLSTKRSGSADSWAANLPAHLDRAAAYFGREKNGAPARAAEPNPIGFVDWLAASYPKAEPVSWAEADDRIRREFQTERGAIA